MDDNRFNNNIANETNLSLSAMAAATTDDFSKAFLAVIRLLSEQVSGLKVEISHLHDRIEKMQESTTVQAEVPDICTRIMRKVCCISKLHNIFGANPSVRILRACVMSVCPSVSAAYHLAI